ncbi:MAG: TetR/AcrR family transcriptional regulator [Actinobacteria bacterium]|nr:TetR/AcrR family transcriptional regulator [Actinomycetota bacterium]
MNAPSRHHRDGAREASRTTRRRHDPARDARRAARKEELLAGAITVIRRDGPLASMDAIAAEAGVTKPILYRHFGDRDGLTQAIAAQFAGELFDELRGALAGSDQPEHVLRATIDAYLGFIERDPQIYRFVVQSPPTASPEGLTLAGFVRQVGQEVSVVLGERMRDVGADSGAAEPWAFGLVGMVHLAGDWWLERRSMPRARLVDYLTALVWNGMGAADAAAREQGAGK